MVQSRASGVQAALFHSRFCGQTGLQIISDISYPLSSIPARPAAHSGAWILRKPLRTGTFEILPVSSDNLAPPAFQLKM
jgi:hypothetical protein